MRPPPKKSRKGLSQISRAEAAHSFFRILNKAVGGDYNWPFRLRLPHKSRGSARGSARFRDTIFSFGPRLLAVPPRFRAAPPIPGYAIVVSQQHTSKHRALNSQGRPAKPCAATGISIVLRLCKAMISWQHDNMHQHIVCLFP